MGEFFHSCLEEHFRLAMMRGEAVAATDAIDVEDVARKFRLSFIWEGDLRPPYRIVSDLYDLVKGTAKPHIVAGDFNALWGDREVNLFLAATGLTNANREGLKSFPSWAPKRQLDFVLHSQGIRTLGFQMPDVTFSDHLPLVYDFELAD